MLKIIKYFWVLSKSKMSDSVDNNISTFLLMMILMKGFGCNICQFKNKTGCFLYIIQSFLTKDLIISISLETL